MNLNFKNQLKLLYVERNSKQFTKLVLPYFKKNVDKSDRNYTIVMEQIEHIFMKSDLKFFKELKEKKHSFDLELLIFLLKKETEITKEYLIKNVNKDSRYFLTNLLDDLLSKAHSLCVIQYKYENLIYKKSYRRKTPNNFILPYQTIIDILDRTAYPLQILVYSLDIDKKSTLGKLKSLAGNQIESWTSYPDYRKVVGLIKVAEFYLEEVNISVRSLCNKVNVNYNNFNRWKKRSPSKFNEVKNSISNEELDKLKPLLIK